MGPNASPGCRETSSGTCPARDGRPDGDSSTSDVVSISP